MQELSITDYNYSDRLTKLAEHFNTSIQEDCDEYSITFDNTRGQGTIRGINFDHGVSLLMIDVNLTEETQIIYDLGRRHPIHFIYSNKGRLSLQTEKYDIQHTIQKGESMIYAPPGIETYTMHIPQQERVQILFVDVVRYLFLRKVQCDLGTISSTLQEMFEDTIGEKSFYFETDAEPIVSKALLELFVSTQTGLERKLLLEANSIKFITSMIKRFRVQSVARQGTYRYSEADIKAIDDAKNYIIDNLENTPNVKVVAQRVGMNANKLQQGFQMLFGKSIRQFTITLKMHMALNLLDRGELTISEIAYKVGYTNKGHFSQLFKKEFGLLPSVYQGRMTNRGR